MNFVANFIRFPEVQKFWKSVKIWQSYRVQMWELFWDTVYIKTITTLFNVSRASSALLFNQNIYKMFH